MRERGQATLPDLLFATLLFLLLIVGVYSFAQNTQLSAQGTIDRRALDGITSNVAEFIIKNPGNPSNWETLGDVNQVSYFGLAQKDRVLDPDKVVAFVNYGNLQYEETKTRLNIPQYEFYITFSGGVTLATGQSPPGTTSASVVSRLVTVNGIETTIQVTVYDDS